MQLHGRPIHAIAIDIDGSYASGIDISDFGYTVLKKVQAEGVAVVVVTGRCEAAALTIAERAGLTAPVISCNGSMITDPTTHERLAVNPLAERDVDVMLELADKLNLQPYVWDSAGIWTDRGGPDTTELGARNFLEITPRPMPERWDQVVKMMVSGPAEYLDRVEPELAATALERCLPRFFEASAVGFSKWDALSLVLDRIGVAPANVLGFGDGGTDVQWLGSIGFPVAVANAAQRIQDIATHRIGHNETDAAPKFVADLLKEEM
ncbi:MAG: HAD hydrolase family protein [Ancrocorticia sp.]|uniref:HAD hydrolase family protein n=1 Tax=Ancrocorticia sp. TaxID=2593684 RepID=UPI003F8DE9D7